VLALREWRVENGEWKAADASAPFTLYLVPFALKERTAGAEMHRRFFLKSLNFEILKFFLRQPTYDL
jgi:hypothetical protein